MINFRKILLLFATVGVFSLTSCNSSKKSGGGEGGTYWGETSQTQYVSDKDKVKNYLRNYGTGDYYFVKTLDQDGVICQLGYDSPNDEFVSALTDASGTYRITQVIDYGYLSTTGSGGIQITNQSTGTLMFMGYYTVSFSNHQCTVTAVTNISTNNFASSQNATLANLMQTGASLAFNSTVTFLTSHSLPMIA